MNTKGKILTILFVFVAFAVCFAGEGEDKPVLFTQVNKTNVEFGGRVNVEVLSDKAQGFELLFPKTPEDLGDFSLVRAYSIKAGAVKGRGAGMGYIMSVYSTGTHVIPAIKIPFRKKGSSELNHVYSQQVPIEVSSLLTGEAKDIKDIKGLVPFPANLMILFFILGVLLLIAIIAGGILWRMKRHTKEIEARNVLPPHEIAYQELSRLRAKRLHEKGQVKEFYTKLSDILRYYIEGRFHYHAPEMTTQEFIEKMKTSPLLRDEDKKRLEDFLTHCDMIKFAKYSATQLEMLDSFKAVEDFVDQTRIIETQKEGE